jgi:signal transduction histidine kinase
VQDDGKGFEIPQRWVDLVRKGQLGLVSTVERVHGMNGSIEIHSRPDLGTTVKVKIPVKI